MAKFAPPTNFTFDKPQEWSAWRQLFTRYRIASKLKEEDGEVQVSTLIYAMGQEALYELAESCHFGAQKTENIRDKLVVGIKDKELSKKLQLMIDLTLDTAVLDGEASGGHRPACEPTGAPSSVQEVPCRRPERRGRWDEKKHGEKKK